MSNEPLAIVLMDPELTLPDDEFPQPSIIVSPSPFFPGDFPDVASLVRARQKAESKLHSQVTDTQRAFTPPGFVAIIGMFGAPPIMYGHVISNDEYVRQADGQKPDPKARQRIEDVNRRGWLFGHWHSLLVPEGEWGCNHRAQLAATMDAETFRECARLGWPPVLPK